MSFLDKDVVERAFLDMNLRGILMGSQKNLNKYKWSKLKKPVENDQKSILKKPSIKKDIKINAVPESTGEQNEPDYVL